MLGSVGAPELIVIVLIALLLFGAGRIADIGKGLGQGIKNFKSGLKDADSDDAPKKLPPADGVARGANGEKKDVEAKEA